MDENRVENRLAAVHQLGQSIWYDNIRRSLITSGGLEQLIDHDSIVEKRPVGASCRAVSGRPSPSRVPVERGSANRGQRVSARR